MILKGFQSRSENTWLAAGRGGLVVVAALLSVLCYLCLMFALRIGDMSGVAPLYMMAPVLATILGITLLGERTDVTSKILAATIATAGGFLLAA